MTTRIMDKRVNASHYCRKTKYVTYAAKKTYPVLLKFLYNKSWWQFEHNSSGSVEKGGWCAMAASWTPNLPSNGLDSRAGVCYSICSMCVPREFIFTVHSAVIFIARTIVYQSAIGTYMGTTTHCELFA